MRLTLVSSTVALPSSSIGITVINKMRRKWGTVSEREREKDREAERERER